MIDVVKRFRELYAEMGLFDNAPAIEALAREIRQEAIEEAAKVCEDFAARNANTLDVISPGDTMDVAAVTLTGAVSGLKIAAKAIRALNAGEK